MAFSGTVKLTDLSDFIAPSQACVVKIEGTKLTVQEPQAGHGSVQLQQPRKAGFSQTKLQPAQSGAEAEAVKVTLNDCLACSGCVTSAETVLLEQHSASELMSALQDSTKRVIVSVSPQSRASLAARHALGPLECWRKLRGVLKLLGVAHVLDTSSSRQPSLLETSHELIHRLRMAPSGAADLASDASPGDSQDCSLISDGCYALPSAMEHQSSIAAGPTAKRETSWADSNTVSDQPKPDAAATSSGAGPGIQQMQSRPSTNPSNGTLSDGAQSPQQGLSVREGNQNSKARRLLNEDHIMHDMQTRLSHGRADKAPFGHQVASLQQAAVQVHTAPKAAASAPSIEAGRESGAEGPLPLLVSSCPGWVVYAEKTHGSYVLPYLSKAKSPQGMMGSLVKRVFSRQMGVAPANIFHCTIMPCYDRKLEAAREDLRLPGIETPETDCVLATLDLQQLLDQQGIHLRDAEPDAGVEGLPSSIDRHAGLSGVPGSAGGYLEHAFRTAAWELFHARLPDGPLSMRRLRNDDFREVVLQAQGRPALRFAAAYGFRNIQTLVRKIKRRACEYDFVEIMACPSACLNGGGQLRPTEGQTAAEMLAAVSSAYNDPAVELCWPEQDSAVLGLLQQLQASQPLAADASEALRMSYKDRGKSQLSGMTPSAAADW